MGDRVQAGPLVYIAFETRWYYSLGTPGVDPQANPRIPANRFLVVHMNITNDGAVDSQVPTLMLLDDSGQSFNELSDGTRRAGLDGRGAEDQAGSTEKGTIAFDVAPKHYKFRVSDETDQIVSYIDLPAESDVRRERAITRAELAARLRARRWPACAASLSHRAA